MGAYSSYLTLEEEKKRKDAEDGGFTTGVSVGLTGMKASAQSFNALVTGDPLDRERAIQTSLTALKGKTLTDVWASATRVDLKTEGGLELIQKIGETKETGILVDDELYKEAMAEVDYGSLNMSFLLGESIVYAGIALVPSLIAAIFYKKARKFAFLLVSLAVLVLFLVTQIAIKEDLLGNPDISGTAPPILLALMILWSLPLALQAWGEWKLGFSKKIVLVAFIVFLATLLFPPELIVSHNGNSQVQYEFILKIGGYQSDGIHWIALLLEWLIVLVSAAVTLFVGRDENHP